MVTIRPTVTLAKKMKAKIVPATEPSTTRLGDWYGAEMVLNRKQYILFVSEKTRLPLVIEAAPYATSARRLRDTLFVLLLEIGVPKNMTEAECSEMEALQFGKTKDRSVLGTLKEFRLELEYEFGGQPVRFHNPLLMSLRLAAMIVMPLEEKVPIEATLKVFGVSISSKLKSHLRLV